MVDRRLTVNGEFDVPGVVAAALFGAVLGLFLVYPTFPPGAQLFDGSLSVRVGPVGGHLMFGTLMFLCFFFGVFALNFFYIEQDT